MENNEMTIEITDKKDEELALTDEFIPDYSFLYKIRQLNLKLNENDDNYGFCIDA